MNRPLYYSEKQASELKQENLELTDEVKKLKLLLKKCEQEKETLAEQVKGYQLDEDGATFIKAVETSAQKLKNHYPSVEAIGDKMYGRHGIVWMREDAEEESEVESDILADLKKLRRTKTGGVGEGEDEEDEEEEEEEEEQYLEQVKKHHLILTEGVTVMKNGSDPLETVPHFKAAIHHYGDKRSSWWVRARTNQGNIYDEMERIRKKIEVSQEAVLKLATTASALKDLTEGAP